MAKTDIKTTKKAVPMIYAYTTPEVLNNQGWTKIGYTEQGVDKRIQQQTHTARVEYHVEWKGNATYDDGSNESFKDHDFHRYLVSKGVERDPHTEWFHINAKPEAREMFYTFRETHGGSEMEGSTVMPYTLRDEQEQAVSEALKYFNSHENGEFLWNCKPRFGKTLSVYELAKRMDAEKVLVVTNRPAVANSWYADYCKFAKDVHFDYFASENRALKNKSGHIHSTNSELLLPRGCKYIEFESLQDLKGSKYLGTGVYDKFKKIANVTWDLLVIDEAHEAVDTYKTDELFNNIKRKNTLHLSGTPFKALATAKFASDAIFNWTYVDEQKAKQEWEEINDDPTAQNPHGDLPELCMFTYKMSDMIRDKIKQGIDVDNDGENEDYAFDLNEFFSTGKDGRFVHEASVNKFLDTLTTNKKYPFSTPELRNELKHTLWFLDRVDSVKALVKKLQAHPQFQDYEIINAAGDGKTDDNDKIQKSFDKVVDAIATHDKTITLTVGQLTTGVTIPEWTAVLMLCNIQSESLYMQAAFRAQNPCLFKEGNEFFRKERAYVFDFDPTRSLDTFEKFANNLSTTTTNGGGSVEQREHNIRELLNFFPVISEDDEGEMVELDAMEVLTLPRKIRSTEVVTHGFMSNFLFQNISGIFQAPAVVSGILNKFTAVKDNKKNDLSVNEETAEQLDINEDGEVEIPEEKIEEKAESIFGNKVYGIKELTEQAVETLSEEPATQDKEDEHVDQTIQKVDEAVEKIKSGFNAPSGVINNLIKTAKEEYGKDLSVAQEKRLSATVQAKVEQTLEKARNTYVTEVNKVESDHDELLNEATSEQEVTDLKADLQEQKQNILESFTNDLGDLLNDIVNDVKVTVTTDVETKKKQDEKRTIENDVRDHLRGFSRTIPSFLMAYGDENTTLATFDEIIPNDVFLDVTSITLDEFRFLRDGGDYEENGKTKHYDGHLFDELVFNDSITEFLRLKNELSDYFDEQNTEDIFDYIPPQKTNQIFTPKKVVKEMVDLLEEENPGCFDDDTKTFADLYMKSGLYITEIVKRLYNSEVMKAKYPNDSERLHHIFSKQVYGCAPTEILYRITKNYILGFAKEGEAIENHIALCDTLFYAKEGTLETKLKELFPELED